MTQAQHDAITEAMGGKRNYGKGVLPNPFSSQCKEWARVSANYQLIEQITFKITSLFEPRFITPPETSRFIEVLITMTDSRRILELGMCTGFCTLHMLRAIVGKEGAKITSVDNRQTHDREWFCAPDIAPWFEFVAGPTPDILPHLQPTIYDLVFVDSDHALEHTQREIGALWEITRKGTIFLFHDLPERPRPDEPNSPPVREYLLGKVHDGTFRGLILPTCEQLDCLAEWGEGYDPRCNPHLGVFIRQ